MGFWAFGFHPDSRIATLFKATHSGPVHPYMEAAMAWPAAAHPPGWPDCPPAPTPPPIVVTTALANWPACFMAASFCFSIPTITPRAMFSPISIVAFDGEVVRADFSIAPSVRRTRRLAAAVAWFVAAVTPAAMPADMSWPTLLPPSVAVNRIDLAVWPTM